MTKFNVCIGKKYARTTGKKATKKAKNIQKSVCLNLYGEYSKQILTQRFLSQNCKPSLETLCVYSALSILTY